MAHAPLVSLLTELMTQAEANGELRPGLRPRRAAALTMETVMFIAQSSGVSDEEGARPLDADEVREFCAWGFAKP